MLDENLSIDASGNVVDRSGKQLKVDDDGKVEVKKTDGTVIKVDADTVRKTIEKQKTEDGGSSAAPTQSHQSASPQQQTSAAPKTNPAVQPTTVKPTTPKATEPKPTSVQPTEKRICSLSVSGTPLSMNGLSSCRRFTNSTRRLRRARFGATPKVAS